LIGINIGLLTRNHVSGILSTNLCEHISGAQFHLYDLLLFNVSLLLGKVKNFYIQNHRYDFYGGVVSLNRCNSVTWPSSKVDSNWVINREFGYPLLSGEQSGFEVVSQFTFTHFASLTPLLCVNIDLERLPCLISINIGLLTRHHVSGYSLN